MSQDASFFILFISVTFGTVLLKLFCSFFLPWLVYLFCRWRDVKMRAFDNAKHRTYVDLKVSDYFSLFQTFPISNFFDFKFWSLLEGGCSIVSDCSKFKLVHLTDWAHKSWHSCWFKATVGLCFRQIIRWSLLLYPKEPLEF